MASLTVAPISVAPSRVSSPPAPSDNSSSPDTTRKKHRAADDPNGMAAGADTASLATAQHTAHASLVAVRTIETPTFTPVIVTPTETD